MKKNVLYIVGGVLVLVALAAMLLFVFSGDDAEVPESTLELEGAWKVVAYVQNGTTALVDDQYFVFSGEKVDVYRGGNAEPFASSSFALTPGTYPSQNMDLPDIGRKYSVTPITDNYIRLYESSSVYMEVIRYANLDMSPLNFSEDAIEGEWNVIYRPGAEEILEERLVFADGQLADYRNGAAEPAATVPYYWENGNCVVVDALGVKMVCYNMSENLIMLVELGTGYVWELQRAG